MASTRSKNTPGNYKLEQRTNILSKKYDLYQHSFLIKQHPKYYYSVNGRFIYKSY